MRPASLRFIEISLAQPGSKPSDFIYSSELLAWIPEMRGPEEQAGQGKNVVAIPKDERLLHTAGKIRVIPKLKQHRIVEPMVMPLRVQREKTGTNRDGQRISRISITNQHIE